MSTYQDALKRPNTKNGGKGWAHADAESVAAAWADTTAKIYAMAGKGIFDWLNLTYEMDWHQAQADLTRIEGVGHQGLALCEAVFTESRISLP